MGFAVFEDNEHIIYAAYEGVYRINIHTGDEEYLFHLISDSRIRYNDGTMDSKGRLLLGTTGYKCYLPQQNCLYSWDGKKGKDIITGTSISNGIAFSADDQLMYFVDTPTNRIARYYYDIETGNVLFDKYIIEITDGGSPDGICIDNNGYLYVAQWADIKSVNGISNQEKK